MKITSLLFIICLFGLDSYAQKSDSTNTRYGFYRGFSAHLTELKSKRGVKNGEYKILAGKKVVANGWYKNDERIGRWRFFTSKDSLDQVYNYTSKKVEYNLSNPNFTYYIDSVKAGDNVIYPSKVGGTLGLFFLCRLFKPPYEIQKGSGAYNLLFVFTLDENGRLIKFETKIAASNYNKIEEISLKRLEAEDFEFSPAKVNGKNVACTMVCEGVMRHMDSYQ
jgi:hypothetical protein